jgi:hypothetical protein
MFFLSDLERPSVVEHNENRGGQSGRGRAVKKLSLI